MEINTLLNLLDTALQKRLPDLDGTHQTALRLFNGFFEGLPGFTVDLFGRTLLLSNLANPPAEILNILPPAAQFYREHLSFVQSVLLKTRHADGLEDRRGVLLHGDFLADRILENGTWYALDLRLNQDASFYLDTRNLRTWLKDNLAGKTVLNTFAYTGSLGIAALTGGAASVFQTDLNPRYLDLAVRSARLNPDFPGRQQLQSGDFFRVVGGLRRQERRFDCVILDAPFFSRTEAGKVDLVNQFGRLINKIRPLIAHNGWLVAINNALFVSGQETMAALQALCTDGYLEVDTLISVPGDITGYAQSSPPHLPADPAPFNHSTKITLLRVQRKDHSA